MFRIKQIMLIQISFKMSVKKKPLNQDGHDSKDNIQMNSNKFSMSVNVAIDLYRATIVRSSRHP
jgi:hypothetical protein